MHALLLLAVLSKPLIQQSAPTQNTVSAAPSDVDTVDHLMAALYDVISGAIGQKHNWDRMRSLFAPDAPMSAVVITRSGVLREVHFSCDQYIERSGPFIEKTGFFEREISRKTESWAHITHVFSTYESRYKPEDKKPFERGINSIQLFNDGKRWWIRSIMWEGETATQKLPGKYTR